MSERISKIELHQVKAPLVVPFAVAYGTTTFADLIIIKAIDAEGRVGLGECAPASDMNDAQKKKYQDELFGTISLLTNLTPADALDTLAQSKSKLMDQWPLVYCGAELAIRALQAAQSETTKLNPLFSKWPTPHLSQCSTDLTIPLMDKAGIAPFLSQFSRHGFETIKVKLSGNVEADMMRLDTIDKLLPANTEWFFDGNQGFDVESAANILRICESHGWRRPLFFEQPLNKHDWEGSALLCNKTDVPICLDEAVTQVSDIVKMIESKSGHMINLKLMKSGIAETETMITFAKDNYIPMMIGGMVESEITMGASLDLFCASSAIAYADLDTPFFMLSGITEVNPWNEGTANLNGRSSMPKELTVDSSLLVSVP
jgi:L-alanine-DL-glutamate epimerase-like enolase superfamily enzyme